MRPPQTRGPRPSAETPNSSESRSRLLKRSCLFPNLEPLQKGVAIGPVGPEEASPSAPVGKTPSVRENIIENVTQILERDRSERLVVRVLPPGRSMSVSIVGDDGSSFLDAEGNLLGAESNVILESKQ